VSDESENIPGHTCNITIKIAITILQFNVAVVPKLAIIINIQLIGDLDPVNLHILQPN
jgi:hypothetical protein